MDVDAVLSAQTIFGSIDPDVRNLGSFYYEKAEDFRGRLEESNALASIAKR